MSTNKIVTTCFCAALLCSCSASKQNEWFVSHNGNMPSEERIARVEKGDSKDDVLRLLGVPSSVMSFDENTWIYMSSDIKRVAFFEPKEISRDILKISFNADDRVTNISHLTQAEGEEIKPDADKTDINGENIGFFRKYFGGVGQYNPFAGQRNPGSM